MLHYVHQLVSNSVCLLFDAGQVVYTGFVELFLSTQLPGVVEINTEDQWEWTTTGKFWAGQLKNELKLTLKLSKGKESWEISR